MVTWNETKYLEVWRFQNKNNNIITIPCPLIIAQSY